MTKNNRQRKNVIVSHSGYPDLLSKIKDRIRIAQIKAAFSANSELLLLYWDVGRMLTKKQAQKSWGSGFYRRLSLDIKNELSDIKGFSERNLNLIVKS
jgi:hypothetical protein